MRAALAAAALWFAAPCLAGTGWCGGLAAQGLPGDTTRAPARAAPGDPGRATHPLTPGDTARAGPPAEARDTLAARGDSVRPAMATPTIARRAGARDTSWAGVPPPLTEAAAAAGDTVAAAMPAESASVANDSLAAAAPATLDAAVELQDTLPGTLATRPLAGGGRLVLYGQPESALIAVRISFPLAQEFGPPESLARMAQTLASEELELSAAPFGARVQMDRSATHASFAITGAAENAVALVGALRQAVAWGDWDDAQVRTARLIAAARALQDRETPEPLLRHRLATLLFPELPANADSIPEQVRASTLHRFWAASFRPDRMQAVVVGRIADAQAAALLGGWPAPRVAAGDGRDTDADQASAPGEPTATGEPAAPTGEPGATGEPAATGETGAQDAPAVSADDAPQQPSPRPRQRPTTKRPATRRPPARRPSPPTPPPPDTTPAPAPPQERPPSTGQPQVLFPWAGVGWPTGADLATAAVAARLIEAHFPGGMLRQARAELWWHGSRRALVLIGSATAPAQGAGAPRPVLQAAAAEAASNVTADEVAAAHLDVARDILLAGRTPAGLADYLGQMYERSSDPMAGQAFLRQLERVSRTNVERTLRRLGTGAAAEVRP